MRDVHLDPDTLAAFAAKALSKQEAAHLFTHLAECQQCRDCLRLHSQLGDFPFPEPVPPRAPYFFLKVAAATAGALAALCLVTPIRHYKVTAPPLPTTAPSQQRRTFTFALDATHPKRHFKLPGSIAAAHLSNNVTFAAFPAKPPLHIHQIALQTSLGERWIALDFNAR